MRAGQYVLYGSGQLGINILARFLLGWIVFFADTGKDDGRGALVAAAAVGAMMLGLRIFDGITDPLAGGFGDYWVGKGRQRRSLLWIAFAIPAVGLLLAFAPTHAMSSAMRWTFLGLGSFLFFVGYTLYAIPYWSLIEDYSEGNSEVRTALSNTLGIGVLAATAVGFIASPLLIQRFGYLTAAGVFCVLAMVLMVLPYFAAPASGRRAAIKPAAPLFSALGSALSDRRFLAVILLFAGAQMSFTVMTAAAPYIATKLLGGTKGDVTLLLAPFLVTAMITFAAVPRISARIGWEKATLLAATAVGVAYGGTALLGKGVIGSPVTTAMFVFAAAGPGAAFVLGLEGEAIARSAAASHHKSTAIYFGVYNFIVKGLNGLALFITGLLASQNSLTAVRTMPMVAGGLCVLGVVLYLSVSRARAR